MVVSVCLCGQNFRFPNQVPTFFFFFFKPYIWSFGVETLHEKVCPGPLFGLYHHIIYTNCFPNPTHEHEKFMKICKVKKFSWPANQKQTIFISPWAFWRPKFMLFEMVTL